MEPTHGRARVFQQHGDAMEVLQESIESCPVAAAARAKLAKEAQEKNERFEKTVTEETARSIAATDAKLKDSLKIGDTTHNTSIK